MLKLFGRDQARAQECGPEVAMQLAAVLMQLLAVPAVRPETLHGEGETAHGGSAVPESARTAGTAAEAVEGLEGAELGWDHLDESSVAIAGS